VAAAAQNHVQRPPRFHSKGGGRRTAAPSAAATAPLNNNTCGGRHATPVDVAPLSNSMCGGRRATTSAAGTVKQQQGRRPPRVPCISSLFGGWPLVRPPPRKRDKGGGCRRPTLCGRHRE